MAAAIAEKQQWVADQSGFGYDRTQSTRSRESDYGDDYMKKKGKDVGHAAILSNLKRPAIQHNW